MQGVEPYLNQAEEVYNENFKPETWFESCIFLSEYPGTNDYDYNYWMAARELVADPKMAKRSVNSLLAEAYLAGRDDRIEKNAHSARRFRQVQRRKKTAAVAERPTRAE